MQEPPRLESDRDLVPRPEVEPPGDGFDDMQTFAEQSRQGAAAAAPAFGAALAGSLAVATDERNVTADLEHGCRFGNQGSAYCAATEELWRSIDRAIIRTVSVGTSPTAVI